MERERERQKVRIRGLVVGGYWVMVGIVCLRDWVNGEIVCWLIITSAINRPNFPYSLTHSTQHSPSSTDNQFYASKEFPQNLWKPKFNQVPTNCPYPEPARSSPYHHIPHPEGTSYIIQPSTPVSRNWSLSFKYSPLNGTYVS